MFSQIPGKTVSNFFIIADKFLESRGTAADWPGVATRHHQGTMRLSFKPLDAARGRGTMSAKPALVG